MVTLLYVQTVVIIIEVAFCCIGKFSFYETHYMFASALHHVFFMVHFLLLYFSLPSCVLHVSVLTFQDLTLLSKDYVTNAQSLNTITDS